MVKSKIIEQVVQKMTDYLNEEQLLRLEDVLYIITKDVRMEQECYELAVSETGNEKILRNYIACKRLENCAEGTLLQYYSCMSRLLVSIGKPVKDIGVNDLRWYLASYREQRQVGSSYLETLRHYISSFFTWAHMEGYINNNPAMRLKRVKVPEKVRKPFSAMELEVLKRAAGSKRDLAIIEVLSATGMRIGELTALNREQINFIADDILIYGQKGKKERYVYLSETACYHLREYLQSREDNHEALFVTSRSNPSRLSDDGIRRMLDRLEDKTGIANVHPHRFRRTMATNALDRGIPIEQVQEILGHKKLDTTRIYCVVQENTVRTNYRRLMAS